MVWTEPEPITEDEYWDLWRTRKAYDDHGHVTGVVRLCPPVNMDVKTVLVRLPNSDVAYKIEWSDDE